MTRLEACVRKGVLYVSVRVKPRASHTRVLGVREGALEVRVAAAPVEGRANRELLEALSRFFAVPRSSVALVGGERGRNKQVAVEGLGLQRLHELLDISD